MKVNGSTKRVVFDVHISFIKIITIEKQHIQTVSTVISLNTTSVNCWYGYVLNYIWRYNINLRGFSKTNCYLLLFWQIEYANVHVFGRRANVTMLLKFTFKKHQNQRKLVCMPICYTKRLYVFLVHVWVDSSQHIDIFFT